MHLLARILRITTWFSCNIPIDVNGVVRLEFRFSKMLPNVRRYVLLAQSRGGACFCTRGAMQGYDGYSLILALAKTVTPAGGPRREPGQAVAPATKPPLIYPVVAPRKANDIYRPVRPSLFKVIFRYLSIVVPTFISTFMDKLMF